MTAIEIVAGLSGAVLGAVVAHGDAEKCCESEFTSWKPHMPPSDCGRIGWNARFACPQGLVSTQDVKFQFVSMKT